MNDRILILGCGVIGGQVLDLLARGPDAPDLRIVARREGPLLERVNLAITVALSLGFDPRISHEALDVRNTDALAALIRSWDPSIIVNATSDQTFWATSLLPEAVQRRLAPARIGPWLPHHLAPARRVMEAARMAGSNAKVVNVSFPDAVNAVLGKQGLAPTVGSGNLGNAVPTLRRAVASQFGVSPSAVDLDFVAHHVVGNAIATFGSSGGMAYHLSARIGKRDVSRELDRPALERLFTGPLRRTRGVAGQIVAASCAARVVQVLRRRTETKIHAPGPLGLVGGYPILASSEGVKLALSEGMGLAEAVAINEEGQRSEGIERIDRDGTVHFAEPQMACMKEVLGYHRSRMAWDEIDDCSRELSARFEELKRKEGVA